MLMPRRLGVVFGVNQVVFAELGDDGTWRTIVSSDTSMGGVIADPTGTGELTDDGRYLWAAQIEACLFAAAVATDPARPIPMPRDLPAHAHRLALRERQASTWRELTQLRGALGDPTVLPLSRYVQLETGGRSGSPVALGHHPDPAAWASLDFRLRGKSVRIDTLAPTASRGSPQAGGTPGSTSSGARWQTTWPRRGSPRTTPRWRGRDEDSVARGPSTPTPD